MVTSNILQLFWSIKDLIWGKLEGWIDKCLAAAGTEVLIKAVAQAIPTFFMSCFLLPRGLCYSTNTMLRKFLWGSRSGENKVAWVSWDVLTMPKYMGSWFFETHRFSTWQCLQNKHGDWCRKLTR